MASSSPARGIDPGWQLSSLIVLSGGPGGALARLLGAAGSQLAVTLQAKWSRLLTPRLGKLCTSHFFLRQRSEPTNDRETDWTGTKVARQRARTRRNEHRVISQVRDGVFWCLRWPFAR